MPKVTEVRKARKGEVFLGGCGAIVPFMPRKQGVSEMSPNEDTTTTNKSDGEKRESNE